MAKVVLGLGTSHSSQLSLSPGDWAEQAELDKGRTPWEELLQSAPASMRDELRPKVMARRYERMQLALTAVSAAVDAAEPDVLVVVGDDQDEMFPHQELVPSVALALVPGLYDRPVDYAQLPPVRRKSMWAMHGEVEELYPVAADLSAYIAGWLADGGFDISVLRSQPADRTLGHAWTFIRRRILVDRIVPMVPVFLNTYFGPNRPTPERCVSLGAAIAEAVAAYPQDLRVGLVASGGLSHFVIDEHLDRRILDALEVGDTARLAAEAPGLFTSGTSEVLNWITVGSALRGHRFELIDYIPAYRSLAGTGVGCAFATWTPKD